MSLAVYYHYYNLTWNLGECAQMENYIFDFDGTLADSGQAAVLATQSAFKEFNLATPTTSQIEYYMGIPIEVSFKKMAPGHFFSEQAFSDLLTIFRRQYQIAEQTSLTLFPQMKSVLQQLMYNQKHLFVVSSKHSTPLKRNLVQLHIAEYFQAVVGSDQVTHFKPAPDGVLQVLNQYSLSKDDSIMIGDAIFDLQMGQAANIHTCGVTWGAHSVNELNKQHPDYLLNTVSDLLTIH